MISLISVLRLFFLRSFVVHRMRVRANRFIGDGKKVKLTTTDGRRCGMCSILTMAFSTCFLHSSSLFSHNGFLISSPSPPALFDFRCLFLSAFYFLAKNDRKILRISGQFFSCFPHFGWYRRHWRQAKRWRRNNDDSFSLRKLLFYFSLM